MTPDYQAIVLKIQDKMEYLFEQYGTEAQEEYEASGDRTAHAFILGKGYGVHVVLEYLKALKKGQE